MIKIAVPENKIYAFLTANSKEVCRKYGIKLFPVSEKKASDLMLDARVDAALLSPLGYGHGHAAVDYRIVPGPALALEGFSNAASIYFRSGINTIKTCLSPSPDDFLMRIGAILLAERYNLHPTVDKKAGGVDELLKEADSALVYGGSSHGDGALDLAEEWHITYEAPLPLAFWVCRNEECPDAFPEIISSLTEIAHKEENIEEKSNEDIFDYAREGKIIRHWNDEIEAALEMTLQLLYFHQALPAIPAIKILGAD